MTAPGTKLTLPTITRMSAFGGKADMAERGLADVRFDPKRTLSDRASEVCSVSTLQEAVAPIVSESSGQHRQIAPPSTQRKSGPARSFCRRIDKSTQQVDVKGC